MSIKQETATISINQHAERLMILLSHPLADVHIGNRECTICALRDLESTDWESRVDKIEDELARSCTDTREREKKREIPRISGT